MRLDPPTEPPTYGIPWWACCMNCYHTATPCGTQWGTEDECRRLSYVRDVLDDNSVVYCLVTGEFICSMSGADIEGCWEEQPHYTPPL